MRNTQIYVHTPLSSLVKSTDFQVHQHAARKYANDLQARHFAYISISWAAAPQMLDTYTKYSRYYVLMHVVFKINYFNNLNFSIMCFSCYLDARCQRQHFEIYIQYIFISFNSERAERARQSAETWQATVESSKLKPLTSYPQKALFPAAFFSLNPQPHLADFLPNACNVNFFVVGRCKPRSQHLFNMF